MFHFISEAGAVLLEEKKIFIKMISTDSKITNAKWSTTLIGSVAEHVPFFIHFQRSNGLSCENFPTSCDDMKKRVNIIPAIRH